MINVTSQYPTQTFLTVGATQIQTQCNNNNSGILRILFPKKYRRTSAAVTAPDGSGAAMSQIDVLIGPDAFYAVQNTMQAQRLAFEAAGYLGYEYYIEAPLSPCCYQILSWASNI